LQKGRRAEDRALYVRFLFGEEALQNRSQLFDRRFRPKLSIGDQRGIQGEMRSLGRQDCLRRSQIRFNASTL